MKSPLHFWFSQSAQAGNQAVETPKIGYIAPRGDIGNPCRDFTEHREPQNQSGAHFTAYWTSAN
jgi:hypothetical protein